MAAKAMETKTRSVLATYSSSQRNKRTDKDTIPSSSQEKPIPSYLRPTISSSKSSIKQQQQQHLSEPATKKTAPVDKAPSPISPNSTPSPKPSKTAPKTSNIVKATPPSKASARNVARGTNGSAQRKQEAKTAAQQEKVVSVDVERKPLKHRHDNEERSEGERSLHYDASEESVCGGDDQTTSEEGDSNKYSRCGIEKKTTISCNSSNAEKGGRKLNFRQGKELSADFNGEKKKEASNNEVNKPPPAYNAVTEEATSKLKEKRNKVLALVGTFETVLSLNEAESQQESPPKGELQSGQPKKEEKGKRVEDCQESQQLDVGQTGRQTVGEVVNNVADAENLKQVTSEPIKIEDDNGKEELIRSAEDGTNGMDVQGLNVQEKVKGESTEPTKYSQDAVEEERLTEPTEKLNVPMEGNDNATEEKTVPLEGEDASPKENNAAT